MLLGKTLAGLLAASIGYAQNTQFRAHSREVIVPVSVVSHGRKRVEGLSAQDFVVLSDGAPQPVRLVSREADPLPIYAVLVLQTGDAGEAAIAKIKKTASIVSEYITNDMGTGVPSQAAIVSASDIARLAQDFTADPDRLSDVFAKLQASGDADHILDGVDLACDLLAHKSRSSRRIIVLISEPRDRGSKAKFADVLIKAQKNDVAIYTASYSAYTTAFTQKASERQPEADQPGAYDPNNAGGGGMPLLALGWELARLAKRNVAEALAQQTGGVHDKFTTLRGLEAELADMGNEIHNRYTLAFAVPDSAPAGYHRLSVLVRKPGNWRIHARAGYWIDPIEVTARDK